MSTVAMMAATGKAVLPTVLLMGSSLTPFIYAYRVSSLGWGAKFSDPATLPTGRVRAIAVSPDKKYIALGLDVSPFLIAYEWSNINGFVSKVADPATAPTSSVRSLEFTPAGDAIIYVTTNTPFQGAHRWTGTGFGTVYTAPSVQGTVTPSRISISPTGLSFVMTNSTTPYIYGRRWDSSTGFGTVYANPATALGNISDPVTFSFDGGAVGFGNGSTNTSGAYHWTDASGFGTKYVNQTITSPVNAAKFTKSNMIYAGNQTSNTGIAVFRWNDSTGFTGQQFFPPTITPTPASTTYHVAMNDDETLIAMNYFNTTPWVQMWPFNNTTGFGTVFPSPSPLPGSGSSNGSAVTFITQQG